MLGLLLIQVVALEGATVHTMAPGEEPAVATVLVEDGRVEAVGPDLAIPADARRVDLSGKHLVPGLIDGMAHHDPEQEPLYTSAGVLVLRDAGNELERVAAARMGTENSAAVGPDLSLCGLVFDGQPPATTNSVVVTSVEEAEGKLEQLLEWEIDFVAIHTGIPLEAWRALLGVAHDAGLQVWGPPPRGASLDEVASAGQDGLFFLDAFAPAGETGVLTGEEIAAHARTMVEHDVALTPVLGAYTRYLEAGDEDALALLAPTYEMQWKSEREGREAYADQAWTEGMRRRIESQHALLRAFHEAGVELVPGSGAPHPWLEPGDGLHDELALWNEAGIPAHEVLRLATAGAARTLGIDDRYGTITPGRVANLVAVHGDPREDLSHLRRPAGIVLRGVWYEGEELALWRDGVREHQDDMRAALEEDFVVEPPELPEGAALVLSGTAETRVFGLRSAVEEYAVARLDGGELLYAMRRASPPGTGMPDTVTHLTQTFDEDTLTEFDLQVTSGGTVYSVTGVKIGGQFRIARRVDGQHLDNNSTTRRPRLIDVGGVLPSLILAKHRGPGTFNVLYFEGMDPALGRWTAELRENGLFAVSTQSGGMVAALGAGGGLERCQRRRGNDVERTASTRSTTFGGPGLALPAERVWTSSEGADETESEEEEGPTVR